VKDVMTSDDRHFAPFRDEDHVVRRREAHKAWLDVLETLRAGNAGLKTVDKPCFGIAGACSSGKARPRARDGQAELFGIVARRPLARCGRTNCRRPVNLQDAVYDVFVPSEGGAARDAPSWQRWVENGRQALLWHRRCGQAELFGIVARRPLARCGRTNCRRPVNLQDAVSPRPVHHGGLDDVFVPSEGGAARDAPSWQRWVENGTKPGSMYVSVLSLSLRPARARGRAFPELHAPANRRSSHLSQRGDRPARDLTSTSGRRSRRCPAAKLASYV
jgi:hypothetical protein